MQTNEFVKHPAILKTIGFLEYKFQQHPHYSFNDWTIMYQHSVNVMHHSLHLAEQEQIDKLVLAITALLHDIGKTLERDEKILREHHEALGKEVSSKFIDSLEELTEKQKSFIKELFQKDHPSLEKKLMKDADYLDFYQNEKLHDAFKTWADENNLPEQIEKKIVRFEKMSEKAQAIARPHLQVLKKKWQIT